MRVTTVLLSSLALLVPGIAAAQPQQAQARQAQPAAQNYGEYSRVFARSAGQYWSGGQAAGQWAWRPMSSSVSDISWGDPKAWPPKSAERFIRSGNWLLLDGYSEGATKPVTQVQRVTWERIGDGSCRNLRPVSNAGGRQHYVLWNLPTVGYCLDAKGTIRSTKTGAVVHFRHRQQWGTPRPCSNAYLKGKTCITQHEIWWDDNGHPYRKEIERTQYIAKGLGHAFMIRATVPIKWNADARYYWTW